MQQSMTVAHRAVVGLLLLDLLLGGQLGQVNGAIPLFSAMKVTRKMPRQPAHVITVTLEIWRPAVAARVAATAWQLMQRRQTLRISLRLLLRGSW